METDFANIEGMFKFNTDIVSKAIKGVTPADWFRKPGDDSNHLMWVLGHLVVHRGRVLKTLGGEWDASWEKFFERGAERVPDSEYPAIEEMRTAWTHVSSELATTLRNSSQDVLSNPAPAGPPSFDGTLSGTVAFYAFHDTYHVGQVSFLRKWLGYGQTVG